MQEFIKPSMEMIAPQKNDPIVNTLNGYFRELIEETDASSTRLSSAEDFFKDAVTSAIFKKIDAALTERFGINFKHMGGDGVGYAVYPVPPMQNTTLDRESVDTFDWLRTYLKKKSCKTGDVCNEYTEKDRSKYENAEDYNLDFKIIMNNYFNSASEFEKKLMNGGVKIDLNKAKIIDLPEDYRVTLLIDPYMLIVKYKLTADEIVAALLHEVGHAFTHIEYVYKSVYVTSVVMDNIAEAASKGYSVTRTLNLVYKNALDGEEDLTKMNDVKALIKFSDKYMEQTLRMNEPNNHSYTDSEQLADQFAGRFGLGEPLGRALYKLHNYGSSIDTVSGDTSIVFKAFITLVLVIVGFIAAMPIMIVILATFAYIFLLLSIVLIMTGGANAEELIYDLDRRRFKRIRNELIHSVRTMSLDKKEIKSIITNIGIIDKIIETTSKDVDFIDKVVGNLPWAKASFNLKLLEQKLEDLTENELYLASAKLKTLQGA